MRWRYLTLFMLLVPACFAFVYAVSCDVIFRMSPGETRVAASFERYSATFYQAWFMLLFCLAVHNYSLSKHSIENEKTRNHNFILLIIILITFTTFVTINPSQFIKAALSKSNATRQQVGAIVNTLVSEDNVPKNSNVYIVWQNTSGIQHRIIMLELFPRKLTSGAWSLGQPYYKGDVWTHKISPANFEKTLQNSTHLLLAHPDKQFWNTYGVLFGQIPDDMLRPQLYRIEKNGNGSIKLILDREMNNSQN
jgi:hypothetical protein